jgi:multimeric flavodoxin WrbA
MKIIAVNGSARKNGNTAAMLQKALEGAASAGAKTELVHLYELAFKGCTSCFACKMKGGPSEGTCAMKDDATPVLQKIEREAEALLLGSPIYFSSMSGEMRSFLERLLFAPFVYSNPPRSLFPRRIRTGIIYTMNVAEGVAEERYGAMFKSIEFSVRNILGPAETLCAYDTHQFPDYSKVVMEYMDPAKKKERREKLFPEDCGKAFDLGRRLVSGE